MSWVYVPGMEDSSWDSDLQFQTLEASVMWRGKPRALKSWQRGCATATWIKRLSGRISAPSTVDRGVESWIASLRESRASRGVPPENARASTTSGTSERSLSESLTRWDRASSSWRTSAGLFDSEPPIFSGDWPTSGSMRSGACFRARESAPLTDGSACSFWPTATAGDAASTSASPYSTESGRHSGTTLTDAQRAWPTPSVADTTGGRKARSGARSNELLLNGLAAMWPTPQARDHKSADSQESGNFKRKVEKGYSIDLNSQAVNWPNHIARDHKSDCPDASPGYSLPLDRQVPQGTGPKCHPGSTRPSPEETEPNS